VGWRGRCLFLFLDRLLDLGLQWRRTFANRRVAVNLEHLGVVRVTADIKANKLAFLSGNLGGIKVANGVYNAKWLFGGCVFILGLGATHGDQQAKG